MNKWFTALEYAKYRWKSFSKYDVHSPFVFEFITGILEDKRDFSAFYEIELLRNLLLQSEKIIEVTDFGAGSYTMKTKKRPVKIIASTNLISPKFGRLLFRIVHHYKPETILEIGTSLGISTLYLAKAKSQTKLISLEGSESIAEIAQENFRKTHANNIELMLGEFSHTLPQALQQLQNLDLLFIDGNHRKQPTLDYYLQSLPYLHENSIVVFDDIYWSKEMAEAWKIIQQRPEITLSFDLFFKGIVFFKKAFRTKQHFILRY